MLWRRSERFNAPQHKAKQRFNVVLATVINQLK